MRAFVLAVAAVLAACSPPANTTTTTTTTANDTAPAAIIVSPADRPLVDAVTAAVADEVGQPVSLRVNTARQQADWGWIIAQPRKPDGGAIDWAQTRYAARAEAGALDGDGTTFALLQRQNDQWVVRQFVIGPTDVAYLDWPTRYGVPAALLGLSGATTPSQKH
jgi:hypothetical protein